MALLCELSGIESNNSKDKFSILVFNELLDELHGAREEDIPKTAFRTHDGHSEFLDMLLGLSSAPSTSQNQMSDTFKPYLQRWCLGHMISD